MDHLAIISIKIGITRTVVKVIQDYSNKGPRPFPRGDKYDIAKISDKF